MFQYFVLFSLFTCSLCRLTEFYRWKQLKYQHLNINEDDVFFPGQMGHMGHMSHMGHTHSASQNVHEYIPYNNVPMSVAHFKDKLIVTVPRRKPGIPSTLNYISTKLPKGSSPSLRPYPDIRTNELHSNLGPDTSRIVSVYRPRVDDCGRLWFVDTGTLQYSLPSNPNKTIHLLQRPSIWVIDLNTDEVVRRYDIPEPVLEPGHGLISITVDVDRINCDAAFAYIPDLLTFQLHVYSFEENNMWSFSHPSFNSESHYANLFIDGFEFTWRDGIFSITLGDRDEDGYRSAYYHPMASISEYAVNTRVLQDKAAARRSHQTRDHGRDFVKIGVRGEKTQCTMHDMDRHTGVVMFAEVSRNGVSCWNSDKPLNARNVALIDSDNVKMIYPVDLNIDRDGVMWMMTNTIPRFIYGKLDPNTFNFRIWRANVADVIRGTVCEGRDH